MVSGGVRRAALISLTDLNDDKMRLAKSGNWWLDNSQRALANISAVYEDKPDIGTFMAEWLSLYQSHSGERGIFSRKAAQLQASKYGRRDPNIDYSTNPCSLHENTLLFTSEGPVQIKSLKDKHFIAYVNGLPYRARRGSWVSGNKELFRLKTNEGFSLDLTADHRLMTENGWKEAGHLAIGDKVVMCQHDDLSWPGKGSFDEGFLLGMFVGDGNFSKGFSKNSCYFGQIKLWRQDKGFDSLKKACEESLNNARTTLRSGAKVWCDYDRNTYILSNIGKLPLLFGINPQKKHDIACLEQTSSEFQQGFIRGMFDSDGHVEGNRVKGYSIRLSQSDYECLQVVQRMLLRFGIYSRIRLQREEGESLLPDGKGGRKYYRTKKCYRLIIAGAGAKIYLNKIGFANQIKNNKAADVLNVQHYEQKFLATIESFESLGTHDVWDAEVDGVESFDANGFHAHNSEIILRPYQYCNLSEVVVRASDTKEDLERKVRLATILGTIQATLTDFRYINKKWKKNTEEERLLGVSMTGIMDNSKLNTVFGNSAELRTLLSDLRNVALQTNIEFSKYLDIEPSAAITCTKPSGTVSQLTDSASGIHARYDKYYIRRVRLAKTDPLGQFMMDKGYKAEEDFYNKSNWVFSFPIKAPEGSRLVKDITAIEQLEHWLIFQDEWCEHKPSVTIYVGEDEWLEVGNWVYKHIDRISGVSFLPRDTGSYRQAPYESITEEKYNELVELTKVNIDWESFREEDDFTENSKTLACTGNVCEF